MRPGALLREAWAICRAALIPTLLILLVSGTMSFVALTTIGQAAANQSQIAARLEQAGARVLTATDTRSGGFINDRTLTSTCRLSTVERAIAVGTPIDVTNGRIGPGGTKVPAWPFHGNPADAVTLTRGRWPQPGEAITSTAAQTKLGLVEPLGYVVSPTGQQYPIVGSYKAQEPFADLNTGLVVNDTGGPANTLKVVIRQINQASATQTAVLHILAPADPAALQLESPTGLAATASDISSQLVGFGRSLLLLILAVGAFFVATVILADSLIRRRDLGRRRTLGASRGTLTSLVALRTLIPTSIGALAGAGVALLMAQLAGQTIPGDYTTAVIILTILTGALAALPPAWYAATRDPVTIMRTP